MKSWIIAKKSAVKSLLAVICVLSLVATGLTGCGSSQPDEVNTVSNATGGDDSSSGNETQQAQTNVQEEGAYKLPDFDVEEEKPIAVDVDEDWPVEYLADAGGGAFGGGGYPSRDGFEVYAFSPENVRCGYDNTNGFSIKISDTGSEDWHIQLKKNGVKVENGKWYQVTFDAKSSIDRSIMFAMQRDGSADEDWRTYSGNKIVKLGNEWKPYTIIFQMTDDTDNKAVYNISMGSVGGKRIKQQHTVNIKNMKLEELDDTWLDRLRQGDNLLKNPNFEYDDIAWEASVVEPGAAAVTFENGKAVFDISNVGTTDWHVQLKQDSIPMEHGYNYRLTFKASSTASRSINIGFMDNNFVNWYGGSLEALSAGVERTVAVEFYMDKATDNNACMFISMGKIDNMNTPASVITLSDFRLEKLPGRPVSSSGGGGWSAPVVSLGNGWELSYWFGDVGFYSEEEPGSYRIDIRDTGSQDWHVQMQKKGIVLENGKRYRMSFEARSTEDRKIICAIQRDGTNDDVWTSYSGGSGQYQLYGIWQTFTTEFTMSNPTDRNAIYNISLGAVDREITRTHSVYLRNLKLEEIPDEPIESVPVGQEMLTGEWVLNDNDDPENILTEDNGKLTAKIVNVGTVDYYVQFIQKNLTLEKGCTYEFSCDADFDNGQRIIKVGIMQDGTYDWYGGADLTIGTAKRERASSGQWMRFAGTTGNKYTFTFTMDKPTISDGMLAISMGKIEGVETPTGIVTIDNVSLKKTSEKTEEPDDPTKPIEGNILPELAEGNGWALNLNGGDVTPGVATIKYTEDGTVVIDISDVGSAAHSVQFAMELVDSLKLEEGAKYKVYCDVESSVARPISIMVQKKGGDWASYGAIWSEPLSANTKTPLTFEFKKTDNLDAVFAVNLGQDNGGAETPAGTITLSRIAIVKTEDTPEKPVEPDDPTKPIEGNILPKLAEGNGWNLNLNSDDAQGVVAGSATKEYTEDGTVVIDISDVGNKAHSVQFAIELVESLKLEEGAEYTVYCDVESSVARPISIMVQKKGGDWAPYDDAIWGEPLSANTKKPLTFTVKKTDNLDAVFAINLGQDNGGASTPAGKITLSNIAIVKTKDAPADPDESDLKLIADGADNLLNGKTIKIEALDGGDMDKSPDQTKITIKNVGTADYCVKLSLDAGTKLALASGCTYKFTADVKFDAADGETVQTRTIKVGFMDQGYNYWYGGTDEEIGKESKTITADIDMNGKSNDGNVNFYISMGKIADVDTPTGTITLSNLSLVKTSGEDAPTSGPFIAENADNMLKEANATFNGKDGNGGAQVTQDGAKFIIRNVGTDDWHIQYKFSGLKLEKGATYVLKADVSFDADESETDQTRKIKMICMSTSYAWYGGEEPNIGSTSIPINYEFTMNEETDENTDFVISMGQMKKDDGTLIPTPTGTVTISNLSLVKKSDASPSSEYSDEEINTFSSDTVIEESSLDSAAVEEETDEDVTDEGPKTDEKIHEKSDEELKTSEKTPEDTPKNSVTPETVDTSLNEDSNDSDDSN